MGEADQEEGPVDLPPAERVRQGWRTLGLQAKRRKASPGVLGETGRSSIELNLDSVA